MTQVDPVQNAPAVREGSPAAARVSSFVGPPFVHDVFVTYSHGDVSGNDDSSLKRWSQAFARELESELRAEPELGRNVSVFLDQGPPGAGVNPMAGLSEQLRNQVGASAILAVLMTPQYLDSSWCRDERDWWHQAQKAHQIPHDGRIAIARILALPEKAELPALFLDGRGEPLIGFSFYDPELRRPYEWPAPTPDSKNPFRRLLLDMTGRILAQLKSLKKDAAAWRRQQEEAARLSGEGQAVVYLHGRETEGDAWKSANDTLAQSGFVVMPGEPDPVVRDAASLQDLRANRVDTLKECDALVLLGSGDGRAVDADLVVIGRQDRHSARALSNRLLPCALLDTVGLPIATPQRRRSASALQVDWIDGTVPPWLPSLRSWLAAKSANLRNGS